MKDKLDKWDFAFIKLFKSGQSFDIDKLRAIWSERCCVDTDYVQNVYIAEHLADLIQTFNPIDMVDLIDRLNPLNGWKYGVRDTDTYHERLIRVFDSHLAMTEVVKLPGYKEMLDKEQA